MNQEKLAELKAAAAAAKKVADEAGGADDSLNQALSEATAAVSSAEKELEEANQNIDFKKELEDLARNLPPPPPKHTEKEKAKFTVEKIYERFPDLREELPVTEEDKVSALETKLLRNQVEGIVRAGSKTEDEVKYKMFFYDNRIVKTGNIHDDADNAVWLATKNRTRNAISEMRRNPTVPANSGGAGQRSSSNSAPDLSPDDVKRLTLLGLKKVAPDRWEGTKVGLQYNKQTKVWEQFKK